MTDNKQIQPIDGLVKSLSNPDFKTSVEQSLPKHIDVDSFVRTAINAIQTHPQQDKLINSDRRTLFLAIQKGAGDGVLMDGREAALVPFWNKQKQKNDIQYMPMTQGMVKVARNSGQIVSIFAEVVFEQDRFSYRPNIDDVPDWEPDWKIPPSQRGAPVLAYGVVKLTDGNFVVRVLHAERIMQIAGRSSNTKLYDPQTGPDWQEWWRKTVIRNVLKYAPKSSELQRMIDHADKAEFGDSNFDRPAGQPGSNVMDMISKDQPRATETIDAQAEEVDIETGEIQQAEEATPDDQDFASAVEI